MPRRPADMWSDDPMQCDKCGQPHATKTGGPSCTAHRRDGKPCGNDPMRSQTKCRMDGGKSRGAEANAERRQGEDRARRALESFGAPAEAVGDPGPCWST